MPFYKRLHSVRPPSITFRFVSYLVHFCVKKRSQLSILFGFLLGLCLSSQFINVSNDFRSFSYSPITSFKFISYQKLSRVLHDKQNLANILNRLKTSTFDYQEDHPLPLVHNHLFVGVLTAKKFLDSRALTIQNTWGKSLHSNLLFFSSSGSRSKHNLSLVSLPNVDDTYPPQRKSFLMFQFMLDHVLKFERFQWFLRADDDVYVHKERLEHFLAKLNFNEPHLIGQAGLGKGSEFKRLQFGTNENFCMGGPGVLFSRATLQKLRGHLDDCVQAFGSTHEDVEVTRCIRTYAQINCTWSFEMQRLFYHNYTGSIKLFETSMMDGRQIAKQSLPNFDLNKLNLPQSILNEAITLHPIKQTNQMILLHQYFLKQKIETMKKQIWTHKQQLKTINKSTNKVSFTSITNLEYWPTYELVQLSSYSENRINPQRKLESHTKRFLVNSFTKMMNEINENVRPFRLQIDWIAFDYALIRNQPNIGADIWVRAKVHVKQFGAKAFHRTEWRMFQMYLPYADSNIQIDYYFDAPVSEWSKLEQKHSIWINNQNLLQKNPNDHFKFINKLPFPTITIIVPLSGRYEIFERFMKNFQMLTFLDNFVKCVVVLFPDEGHDNPTLQSDYLLATKLLVKMQKHYRIKQHPLKDAVHWINQNGHFSRASALQSAARQLSADSLLFFVDVDMLLDANVLNRVRMNTRKGQSAYFPIVFSEYSPEFSGGQTGFVRHWHDQRVTVDLRAHMGYWRQFGFGIASLFRSDLDAIGGFNLSILGWGKEDVELYSSCVKRTDFEVIRNPDPELLHVHHEIHCKRDLDISQFKMCLGTKYSSLGEQGRLVERILEHNLIV